MPRKQMLSKRPSWESTNGELSLSFCGEQARAKAVDAEDEKNVRNEEATENGRGVVNQ